jgi:hypothetical protein
MFRRAAAITHQMSTKENTFRHWRGRNVLQTSDDAHKQFQRAALCRLWSMLLNNFLAAALSRSMLISTCTLVYQSYYKMINVAKQSALVCGEGPRSRCYGRTAALRVIVQPCDEDEVFFCLSILMEHRWNEIDRGKPKYLERNLSQCHFVYHKSHIDRPGIEPGPPR